MDDDEIRTSFFQQIIKNPAFRTKKEEAVEASAAVRAAALEAIAMRSCCNDRHCATEIDLPAVKMIPTDKSPETTK